MTHRKLVGTHKQECYCAIQYTLNSSVVIVRKYWYNSVLEFSSLQ